MISVRAVCSVSTTWCLNTSQWNEHTDQQKGEVQNEHTDQHDYEMQNEHTDQQKDEMQNEHTDQPNDEVQNEHTDQPQDEVQNEHTDQQKDEFTNSFSWRVFSASASSWCLLVQLQLPSPSLFARAYQC